MKISIDNNFRGLKKLRKLVMLDINNSIQIKGFDDTICEFLDWLIEIDIEISKLKRKKINYQPQ